MCYSFYHRTLFVLQSYVALPDSMLPRCVASNTCFTAFFEQCALIKLSMFDPLDFRKHLKATRAVCRRAKADSNAGVTW